MSSLADYAEIVKGAVAAIPLLRKLIELIPTEEKKREALEAADQLDKGLQIRLAESAEKLGYQLCRCAFPPEIMLTTGRDEYGTDIYRCPRCGRTDPPDEYRNYDSTMQG